MELLFKESVVLFGFIKFECNRIKIPCSWYYWRHELVRNCSWWTFNLKLFVTLLCTVDIIINDINFKNWQIVATLSICQNNSIINNSYYLLHNYIYIYNKARNLVRHINECVSIETKSSHRNTTLYELTLGSYNRRWAKKCLAHYKIDQYFPLQ